MDACNQFLGKCIYKDVIYSHFPPALFQKLIWPQVVNLKESTNIDADVVKEGGER